MAKYGAAAAKKVKKALHERKQGTLKSGKSGKTVKSRKQAIAIGLSEARRAGAKVPPAPKKSRAKKGVTTRKRKAKAPTKGSSGKRSSGARKSASKASPASH